MEINKTDHFTLVKPNINKQLSTSQNIVKFYNDFNKKYLNFKDNNIILDFSGNLNIDLKEILLFSQINNQHKKNKKSFVIVSDKIEIDKLPNEIITVPTLEEAEDIVELEDIERDLGI
ncbi:MAG: ribonuclease Z [Bacteroidota bacterium]